MNHLKAEALRISPLTCAECPMNAAGNPCTPVTDQVINAVSIHEPHLDSASFSKPNKRSQEAAVLLESDFFGAVARAAGAAACQRQLAFYNQTTQDSIVNF